VQVQLFYDPWVWGTHSAYWVSDDVAQVCASVICVRHVARACGQDVPPRQVVHIATAHQFDISFPYWVPQIVQVELQTRLAIAFSPYRVTSSERGHGRESPLSKVSIYAPIALGADWYAERLLEAAFAEKGASVGAALALTVGSPLP
jgi:hypothetical protein